jgi:GPI mannosyltransferase 2
VCFRRNNGFLNYFTPQQLPNFLLAAPMFVLTSAAVLHFARQLRAVLLTQRGVVGYTASVYAYVLHLLLLSALCFFFMHVQVVTRFVVACPAVYWYVASSNAIVQRTYLLYALSYLVIGSTLFSTFYPWT